MGLIDFDEVISELETLRNTVTTLTVAIKQLNNTIVNAVKLSGGE